MSNPFHQATASRSEAALLSREKFKIGFISALVTAVMFVIGILIEGCHPQSGRAEAATNSVAAISTNPTNPGAMLIPAPGTATSPVSPGNAACVEPAEDTAVPATASPPRFPPLLAAAGLERMYVVQPGDTLFRISQKEATSVKALKTLNGLKTDRIDAGQKLKLPVCSPEAIVSGSGGGGGGRLSAGD